MAKNSRSLILFIFKKQKIISRFFWHDFFIKLEAFFIPPLSHTYAVELKNTLVSNQMLKNEIWYFGLYPWKSSTSTNFAKAKYNGLPLHILCVKDPKCSHCCSMVEMTLSFELITWIFGQSIKDVIHNWSLYTRCSTCYCWMHRRQRRKSRS